MNDKLAYDGQTKTLAEWEDYYDFPRGELECLHEQAKKAGEDPDKATIARIHQQEEYQFFEWQYHGGAWE